MSKISIITTTYKHQDFIEDTIKSVLSQTYTNWELLIGDDSPDDKTWNIIQKYVKQYPNKIKAWHHKPNKGIVDNMNFLLSKVSSDCKYIAFLEGDDMYTYDNLEEKIKIFEKYPEVKLIYNNLDFIDGKGKKKFRNYFQKIEKIVNNNLLDIKDFIIGDSFYASYSSLCINKEILNNIKLLKFGDKLYLASDWVFFGEVAHNFKIYGIEKSLTLYRIHSNNNSKDKIKIIGDVVIGIKYLKNKYKINSNLVNYKLNLLSAYISYLKNKKKDTITYILKSFKYSINKDLLKRIGMITLVLLPKKINNYIYNILTKKSLISIK